MLRKQDAIAAKMGETSGQMNPGELPDALSAEQHGQYPTPWRSEYRGNGHFDLLAADGTYVAHVYVWDERDGAVLVAKMRAINGAP